MKHNIALVVPSIREDSFNRFVKEWTPTGIFDRVSLILIEDNPEKRFTSELFKSSSHQHFSWSDIDEHHWSWIIPRRSDTVRSFGYWWAWSQGYDFLMTLDDDCYPAKGYEQLDEIHLTMMERTKWFNTLNNVRPRGVPYFSLGKRDVYVNHGIWQGVLDYDAPQQLVNPTPEVYSHDNRIVPHGAYHPFCGMNVMWRREAIPLSYHLLMGSTKIDRSIEKLFVDRFGDIWCGIIQKKICDHLGWAVSSGTPYIHHVRASNPFTNLRKEASGIEINEWFWEKIDAIELPSRDALDSAENPTARCYATVANAIKQFGGEHSAYWHLLSSAMKTWAELFSCE